MNKKYLLIPWWTYIKGTDEFFWILDKREKKTLMSELKRRVEVLS